MFSWLEPLTIQWIRRSDKSLCRYAHKSPSRPCWCSDQIRWLRSLYSLRWLFNTLWIESTMAKRKTWHLTSVCSWASLGEMKCHHESNFLTPVDCSILHRKKSSPGTNMENNHYHPSLQQLFASSSGIIACFTTRLLLEVDSVLVIEKAWLSPNINICMNARLVLCISWSPCDTNMEQYWPLTLLAWKAPPTEFQLCWSQEDEKYFFPALELASNQMADTSKSSSERSRSLAFLVVFSVNFEWSISRSRLSLTQSNYDVKLKLRKLSFRCYQKVTWFTGRQTKQLVNYGTMLSKARKETQKSD